MVYTYVYTMECYSALKINLATAWMDLEGITLLRELSEKDKQHDFLMLAKKKKKKNQTRKQQQTLIDTENKLVVVGRGGGGWWGRGR